MEVIAKEEIKMPLRPLNRQQSWLLPPTLDELIPDDHPVRFIASFVDTLDDNIWEQMNVNIVGEPLGAPAYHPRALLSVWLYGFMTGTRSSRKLEVACRDQMPYLWLTGWQHPDHNTLWRFYKEHRAKMRHLFKMTVRTALKMDLVDMAVQAVDGTKIQANASRDRTYDANGLQQLLKRTEAVIQELEKQNEEGDYPPPVHLPEKLRQTQLLHTEVKAAIEHLAEEDGLKRINLTDNDAELMKSRQGIVPGYNIQTVVSPIKVKEAETAGGMLITAVDTVRDADDHHQLVNMIEQSEETVGEKAGITVADAGYHSGANLEACEERNQKVAMPESQEKRAKPACHERFNYDASTDSYVCPLGKTLKFIAIRSIVNKVVRVYGGLGSTCHLCSEFGVCTKSRYKGRELLIGPHETLLQSHRDWMATHDAKIAYRRRKELSEPSFGIIKEQIGFRRFLLRGLDNAKMEVIMVAIAFNMRALYRAWCWQLNKARHIEVAGAFILCRFWSSILFIFYRYARKYDFNMLMKYLYETGSVARE
jgi:transposase